MGEKPLAAGGGNWDDVLGPDVGSSLLTGTAEATLWAAAGVFGLQAILHWCRATCVASNARVKQHELLSGAAQGVAALLYLAMACGLSLSSYADGVRGPANQRPFFQLLYAERAIAGSVVLVNLAALARERRPSSVALAAAWTTETAALYLGTFAEGNRRLYLLGAAMALLLPPCATLFAAMGGRLARTPLQTVYRFLATWWGFCSACFCLHFTFCEVFALFDTETEMIGYALLDYCLVGVSSLVVSCAGPDLSAGLLPAQEAELSLYPGPHSHGFYPNPDYYDDNL